jgi:hypothetical protein
MCKTMWIAKIGHMHEKIHRSYSRCGYAFYGCISSILVMADWQCSQICGESCRVHNGGAVTLATSRAALGRLHSWAWPIYPRPKPKYRDQPLIGKTVKTAECFNTYVGPDYRVRHWPPPSGRSYCDGDRAWPLTGLMSIYLTVSLSPGCVFCVLCAKRVLAQSVNRVPRQNKGADPKAGSKLTISILKTTPLACGRSRPGAR